MARKAGKAAKLAEQVAPIGMERDGDDLVIRVKGAYTTRGVPTGTGKDTRKVATTPGMFTWLPDGGSLSHENDENRRMAVKLTVLLGSPRDAETGKSKDKAANATEMSSVSFG